MGKAKSCCFRIFTCADGDSASAAELLPSETQASSDKCPWGFRKRLSRHRVLSKNAVLEPESGFNFAKDICVSEQASIQARPSKEELSVGPALSSTAVNSEISTIVTRNSISNNGDLQESAVIIIQTAIRRNLAVRKLRNVKNIIMLQAAVRGHLVRVQAVETLLCIQAISKMQTIVRYRLTCQLQEKLAGIEGKDEGKFHSTMNLLSNRFAQKLLASAPNTRTFHIQCDPSKLDSAWKWLERWTTIITAKTEEEKEQILNFVENDVKSTKLVSNKVKKNGSSDSKLDPRELAISFESKGDLNSRNEGNLRSQADACLFDSCFSFEERGEQNQKMNDSSSFITGSKGNTLSNISKREHSGSLEIETQKAAMWPRRPNNPAFAAAQSKFKELSSISKNACASSFVSSGEDCAEDARLSNYHSQVKSIKETGFTENLQSHDPVIQFAASECGTEISISSTLDSPDRSETECGEIILEIGSMNKQNYDANTFSDKGNEFQESQSNKIDEAMIYASSSSNALDSSPPTASEVQGQLETSNFQQDKSSIEGTPQSQTVAFETYDTPSSELSVNAISRHIDGSTAAGSNRRLASRTVSKSVKSGGSEHLSNDPKSGKKRRFIAVSRIDLDDEPRTSNSNSGSLPSYMQATKSARAKVHASISPKSSPDMHDKEVHIKKRHSFPIAIEKQDSSPPKQRSTTRAQHNSKSKAVHGPHTSAERRWQR